MLRFELAFSLLLSASALLGTAPARAHGSYPEARQILLPADRPEQIILATNFGLIFSEDAGETWLFSCEHGVSAYASPYLLGAQPYSRIFGMTPGAGLIYSDDSSCSWKAAGGTLTDVLPYAFAVDPSDSQRVYAIGVPRKNLRAGNGIYISDDGGLTFGTPTFTAPASSALLTLSVSPNRRSTLFAAMFSSPENHPILLRSQDSGEHWEMASDLVGPLGENPFELLAVDASDEMRLYARVLGATAETLAISVDGGLSFVPSISIPGKLNAFLKLASGTILVGGTAGTEAVGYRSKDGGQTFEAWPEAPHVHALAERGGRLYIAADEFADGYAIAVSDDEGARLTPLASFQQVRAVKTCVAALCAESCTYYASIGLLSESICRPPSDSASAAAPVAVGAGEPPDVDDEGAARSPRVPADGCAIVDERPVSLWLGLLGLAAMSLAARRARRSSPGSPISGG
jgi:hypothetical protein